MNRVQWIFLGIGAGLMLISTGLIAYHFRRRCKRENPPNLFGGLFALAVMLPMMFGILFVGSVTMVVTGPPPSSVQIGDLVKKQLPNATLQRIDFVKDEPRGWVLLTIGERKNVFVQAVYTQQHGWQLSCQNASGATKPLNNQATANILQQTAQCS